jgi:hypothetical protein
MFTNNDHVIEHQGAHELLSDHLTLEIMEKQRDKELYKRPIAPPHLRRRFGNLEALMGFQVGDAGSPDLSPPQRVYLLGQCTDLNAISWTVATMRSHLVLTAIATPTTYGPPLPGTSYIFSQPYLILADRGHALLSCLAIQDVSFLARPGPNTLPMGGESPPKILDLH